MRDYRILKEWLDANGNKINSIKTSTTSVVNKSKTPHSNFVLWDTFVRAVKAYLALHIELADIKTNHFGDKSGIWRTLHIYDYSVPEGTDISIKYNISTEDYEISADYDGFETIKGNGFNLLMSTLDDIAFTIFELGSFDFKSLRESLTEWVDASGNKVTANTSSATSNIPTKLPEPGYKEKFQKLLDYHKQHVGSDVISAEIKKLNNYGFEYREVTTVPGSTSESILIIEVDIHDDGEYFAYVWQDGKCIDLAHGNDFDILLGLLGKYLKLPSKNSNEYQKLLEWIDSKGNKLALSSSVLTSGQTTKAGSNGYKEKFAKLLNYHMNHLPPTAVDPEIKILQEDEFIYKEHHATGMIENDYDLEVAVAVNKPSDDWDVSVYKYGSLVKIDFGNGWEALLKSLKNILSIPAEGTADYKKLLEWVDNTGNKIHANKLTASSKLEEVVYIWDIYIDPKDKCTWRSADRYNGEYDGYVYETKEGAQQGGINHLRELEDELYLEGRPSDYTVDVVAIPKAEVSDYTLEFSGLQ